MEQPQPDEKPEILMVCRTVARLPVPYCPCNRERCQSCGAEVWVDATVHHDACICIDCALAQAKKIEFSPHPDVEATLRRHGLSDADIERASEYAQGILGGPRREG